MVADSPYRTAPTVERCARAQLFGVRWTKFIDLEHKPAPHDARGWFVLWPLGFFPRLVCMAERYHSEACRRIRQEPQAVSFEERDDGSSSNWWRWTSYGFRLLRHAEGA